VIVEEIGAPTHNGNDCLEKHRYAMRTVLVPPQGPPQCGSPATTVASPRHSLSNEHDVVRLPDFTDPQQADWISRPHYGTLVLAAGSGGFEHLLGGTKIKSRWILASSFDQGRGGGELATKEPEAVVVAGKALDGLLCTDPSAPP
jgi:hypothetical protein